MIYNIDFDLCAVVISVISLFFILLKKGLQRESNRLLFYIILASLASAVFDIWSSFGNSHIRNYSDTYRDILNFLFLFLHTSTSCLFAWYILVLLGLHRIFPDGNSACSSYRRFLVSFSHSRLTRCSAGSFTMMRPGSIVMLL